MSRNSLLSLCLGAAIWSGAAEPVDVPFVPDRAKCEIREGRFFQNGRWVFMKIGKPLLNFSDPAACAQLTSWLPTYRGKGYTALELNCYWHHFDRDGDGVPDVSLEPLAKLVDAVYAAGLYPCLSVETYSVGGGQIPAGFWTAHPDACARNVEGRTIRDDEYGSGTAVVSIHNRDYRRAARTFIRRLTAGVDFRKILWFETTVEPQYMAGQKIDYGPDARREYAAWCARRKIAAPPMPEFPVGDAFVTNHVWNQFRAEELGSWVSGDAAAFRSVAGKNAYVAVDFLYGEEAVQYLRDGDPLTFLRNLEGVDILQVNWHWDLATHRPKDRAYQAVRAVLREFPSRKWAVTEHMTFNGDCYQAYPERELRDVLENTLRNGSGFGWEFVSVTPNSQDGFSLYETDFRPKRVMAIVDDHWGTWLRHIYTEHARP